MFHSHVNEFSELGWRGVFHVKGVGGLGQLSKGEMIIKNPEKHGGAGLCCCLLSAISFLQHGTFLIRVSFTPSPYTSSQRTLMTVFLLLFGFGLLWRSAPAKRTSVAKQTWIVQIPLHASRSSSTLAFLGRGTRSGVAP